MSRDTSQGTWQELALDVLTGMREWRQQHPKATFREIEAALDERMSRLRAQMRPAPGPRECRSPLESASRAGCPQLSSVWEPAGRTRHTPPTSADNWRARGHGGAHLRHLP